MNKTPSEIATEWSKDYKQVGNRSLSEFWATMSRALKLKKPVYGDGLDTAIAHAESMRQGSTLQLQNEAAILIPALKALRAKP